MSDSEFRRGLDIPVNMPMPFDPRHMLSINPQGTNTVNETYVPQHDILNCVPGAFVGMCKLIQSVDIEASTKQLGVSEEDMLKAAEAFRYLLSRDGISHGSMEEAYIQSGFAAVPWQARTWILKNFGDVMLRMWHQAAVARVNNVKDYKDFPVHMAAESLLNSFGKGLD